MTDNTTLRGYSSGTIVVDSFYFTYISPQEINYSSQQIKWILFYKDELRAGNWPMLDPAESIGGAPSGHASFETACLFIGELRTE